MTEEERIERGRAFYRKISWSILLLDNPDCETFVEKPPSDSIGPKPNSADAAKEDPVP